MMSNPFTDIFKRDTTRPSLKERAESLKVALDLPSFITRGHGRMRRLHRVLLACTGHEAGRGNVITTAILLAVYIAS